MDKIVNREYNLEERTARFSEEIIKFNKDFKKDPMILPIVIQLIRSATSIGANYCEANGASSKKDFLNKIHTCKKEAKETEYWLRMLAAAVPEKSQKCRELWKEVHELTLIFSKVASTSRKSLSNL